MNFHCLIFWDEILFLGACEVLASVMIRENCSPFALQTGDALSRQGMMSPPQYRRLSLPARAAAYLLGRIRRPLDHAGRWLCYLTWPKV